MFISCLESLQIYVPAGSVAAYESADGWKDYAASIVGGVVSGDGAGGSSGGGIIDGDDTFLAISVEHQSQDYYYLGTSVQFYAQLGSYLRS